MQGSDQRFAYNIHFKLRKSLLVTAVRQGSSLANSAMLVPPNVSVTVLNRGKGYRWDCYGGNGYWWNRYVSYRSSCADQPGKPHCEVDNDHCNTSQYQQDIVDKYTTVAPKGSIAKLLGSLIVSRIIVAWSLWRVIIEVRHSVTICRHAVWQCSIDYNMPAGYVLWALVQHNNL